MTINKAWENVKYRLDKCAKLSHSYSPNDNEAEKVLEEFITESPLKVFAIKLFNSADSVNCDRTQEYKNGYTDALFDLVEMFIEQE